MIYSRDGIRAVPYTLSGQATTAFDLTGSMVYPDQYAAYAETKMSFNPKSGNQGFDVYGDYIAQWFDDTQISMAKISTGAKYNIQTDIESHGNDVSFLPEFYDSGDEFPLLYVGKNILRLDTDAKTASMVKTVNLPPGNDVYWTEYGGAFNGKTYYSTGYTNASYQQSTKNNIFIDIWDFTNATDVNDVITPTLISRIERPWLVCVQGAAYHDGLLWLACGLSDPVRIYGVNPLDGSIVVEIVPQNIGELEGVAWAYNDTDGWYLIFGQRNNMGYRKVTFSPL